MFVLLVLFVLTIYVSEPFKFYEVEVDLEQVFQQGKPLPRFWTSTGLCPPAPREKTSEFLLSEDSLLNLEIIGSLPNQGLKYVRIHWLLDMINFSHYDQRKAISYDFSRLDAFLGKIREFGLYPGFEFMGVPAGVYDNERKHRFAYFWSDLAMQVASHYLRRYGIQYVSNWRLETWNEPDLKNYNVLNFTIDDYITHVHSIRFGLDAAGRLLNNIHLPLRGPAGLFKSKDHHPFCWKIIELCNDSPKKCPFETITFHRKGSGLRADEILQGGLELMEHFKDTFPKISLLSFSNDEADPISGWSTPREFHSDLRYGAVLASTVLQHWSALFNGRFANLESISHDNGFLSYHPYEFDQRTLLAHFQMNLTHPRHVQYVAKPVFSALGILASLGSMATDTNFVSENISHVVSYQVNPFYLCTLLISSNDTFESIQKRQQLALHFISSNQLSGQTIGYVVEGLQGGLNSPVNVWNYYGKPPYPTASQFEEMRSVQFPSIIEGPAILPPDWKKFSLPLNIRTPWIATVRMCSLQFSKPTEVLNIRVRNINANEVIIFWHEKPIDVRCTVGYEVWFSKSNLSIEWRQINSGKHTPFLVYHYAPDGEAVGLAGLYRVRSVDLFGRVGAFSKAHYHDG
ncbi:AAEL004402-PA [Aedes aegypti]|uniref:AAEL004402-PA n=1 Tax=Aedes aegypti TaxID=7159 RepID=Q17CX0_AEDAE|nr:AAEL004402-PA [Aedes aegypti]